MVLSALLTDEQKLSDFKVNFYCMPASRNVKWGQTIQADVKILASRRKPTPNPRNQDQNFGHETETKALRPRARLKFWSQDQCDLETRTSLMPMTARHTTAVSMLSNDVAVTTLRSKTQTLADLETETWRVEHRSTADHTMHWQTTQLPCHVCHHIHYTSDNNHFTIHTHTYVRVKYT